MSVRNDWYIVIHHTNSKIRYPPERTLLAPFALWRSADTIEVPDERQRGAASGVQASPFCVGGGGAPPHIAAAATADPEMAPPIRRWEFGEF